MRWCECAWPGHVRELEHVIERPLLLSDPPRPKVPSIEGPWPTTAPRVEPDEEEWMSLEEMERRYVGRVLHRVHGRVSGPGGAAEVLKLKPSTLQFWIGRLGLPEELAKARKRRAEAG